MGWLTLFLVLLLGLEQRLVVGPLGGAGSPAYLVAVGGLLWWALHHAHRPSPTGAGRQPVRIAMLCVFLAFLASYAAAMTRAIYPLEAGSAQLGLIAVTAWMGVGLLANDGIPTRQRFDQLVARLVVLAAIVAVIGIAQFATGDTLVKGLSIPGLVTSTSPLDGLNDRAGFTRPSGTALHPIEYGAIIATVLPLAIAWARNHTAMPVLLRWAPTAFLALGAVVSISRSAVICCTIALVIQASDWEPRARRILAGAAVVIIGFVGVAIPGMVGSISGLFLGAGEDNSIASRTDSYPVAFEFFTRYPLFGRGFSTFLPMYRIFDNQYLLSLVEVGLVGLVSICALFITGFVTARRARNLAVHQVDRDYAQALAAGIAACSIGLAFYDGFSFPSATGVLFLALGMSGALLRLLKARPPGEA